MKGTTHVRTSVDIPRRLHRELREAAARRGCSARQLILHGIERIIHDDQPRRSRKRLSLDSPIVPSTGRPFDLTEHQIYELIELP